MAFPSQKAIHYFCVAARHLSFKAAAEELAVTPAAVSQQIRQLEEWLGQSLFRRNVREVSLTEAGNVYFRRVNPLLTELLNFSLAMRRIHQAGSVRITLPPAFALLRFTPMLQSFRERFPGIELQTHVSSLLSPLDGNDHDMAVRNLAAPDRQLDCTHIATLNVLAVCSPSYLEAHPQLRSNDISGCTLIHDHLHPEWPRLRSQYGITGQASSHMYFDQSAMAHQSAVNGLGVWLTDRALSGPALAAKALTPLFDLELPATRHLFLVHNPNLVLSPPAMLTKAWLIEVFGDGDESKPSATVG